MRVYIDDPVLDEPLHLSIGDVAKYLDWPDATNLTALEVKDGSWWLTEAAPGETRLDRLLYMLREVFARYDAPDCDIHLDGRTVRLNVDPRR